MVAPSRAICDEARQESSANHEDPLKALTAAKLQNSSPIEHRARSQETVIATFTPWDLQTRHHSCGASSHEPAAPDREPIMLRQRKLSRMIRQGDAWVLPGPQSLATTHALDNRALNIERRGLPPPFVTRDLPPRQRAVAFSRLEEVREFHASAHKRKSDQVEELYSRVASLWQR
mmetsp:Transcript_3163/g.7399  ORF Transcript_3163/g.7399 Transcript_3163/m.7399 type:complete len:175 (-) Transcript_3163:933-1457(-)